MKGHRGVKQYILGQDVLQASEIIVECLKGKNRTFHFAGKLSKTGGKFKTASGNFSLFALISY